MTIMYHDGNRRLQDQFDSRRISDRLEEKLTRTAFTADDKAFIESAIYFFMSTADAEGRPDCSFKGGAPGFVRITGPSEIAFPDYDGNGMFKSLGNVLVNADVGLLFIAMHGKPQPYDPVPWFWSDQYELKLQMAGLSEGYDDAKTVGDVAAAHFSVEYRKAGRLIAVDAVNDGRAYMSGRKRIAEETA